MLPGLSNNAVHGGDKREDLVKIGVKFNLLPSTYPYTPPCIAP
jgi:hypothetical protein